MYDNKDGNQLAFPGLSIQAAQFLADERMIYGYGIDALSVDPGSTTVFEECT
jgi:kynurenine formamidase